MVVLTFYMYVVNFCHQIKMSKNSFWQEVLTGRGWGVAQRKVVAEQEARQIILLRSHYLDRRKFNTAQQFILTCVMHNSVL